MTEVTTSPHEQPPAGEAARFATELRAILPRLETARLVLRAITLEDFPTFFEIFSHPTRSKGLKGPFDRDGAWTEFTGCVSSWLLRGFGTWAIEARSDGALLGFVLVNMEPGDQEPELGWFITEAAEGKGYAFEAAEAARSHALETLRLPSLVSYMGRDNARSARLAKRLGAARDATAEARAGGRIVIYRHWPPADDDGGMEAYA